MQVIINQTGFLIFTTNSYIYLTRTIERKRRMSDYNVNIETHTTNTLIFSTFNRETCCVYVVCCGVVVGITTVINTSQIREDLQCIVKKIYLCVNYIYYKADIVSCLLF